MKKIRFLKIQFDAEIEAWELPAFRGAVAAKAGLEHLNFHNHLNDTELLYGYPVIQYKRIGKNPGIVCVDYGVDEIHHLFNNRDMDIVLGERPIRLSVKSLQMNQYNLQVWEKAFKFEIRNWLGLNQENFHKYKELKDELSQIAMLEGILKANILSFAKGMKWDVDKPISLRIDEIVRSKIVPYKSTKLLAFDLKFRTNVFLPDFLGLGKGVSLGFGTITQERDKTIQRNNG